MDEIDLRKYFELAGPQSIFSDNTVHETTLKATAKRSPSANVGLNNCYVSVRTRNRVHGSSNDRCFRARELRRSVRGSVDYVPKTRRRYFIRAWR